MPAASTEALPLDRSLATHRLDTGKDPTPLPREVGRKLDANLTPRGSPRIYVGFGGQPHAIQLQEPGSFIRRPLRYRSFCRRSEKSGGAVCLYGQKPCL